MGKEIVLRCVSGRGQTHATHRRRARLPERPLSQWRSASNGGCIKLIARNLPEPRGVLTENRAQIPGAGPDRTGGSGGGKARGVAPGDDRKTRPRSKGVWNVEASLGPEALRSSSQTSLQHLQQVSTQHRCSKVLGPDGPVSTVCYRRTCLEATGTAW